MDTIEDTWDDGFDAAWRSFQRRLADRLAALQPGSRAEMWRIPAEDQDDPPGPFVDVWVWEHGVAAEISDVAPLTEVARALAQIGWLPDHDDLDARMLVETKEVDRIAVMVVRALRDVFGVLHPSFLKERGLDDVVALGRPGRDETVVWPGTHGELNDLVSEAFDDLRGGTPRVDVGFGFALQVGESVIFGRVSPFTPLVEVTAKLVTGVSRWQEASYEVNLLNRDSEGPTFFLEDRDGSIIMRQWVSGAPYVPGELRRILHELRSQVDRIAHDLVGRVGGRTFTVQCDHRRRSSDVRLARVLDAGGNASAGLTPEGVAAIFGHDKDMLAEQVADLARGGSEDLLALVSRALGVVAEREAARKATS